MQTDHDHDPVRNEFDCAVCGYERIAVRADRSLPCPNCDQSYSLVRRDGFVLVKTNGWIARVAVDPHTDPISGAAGG